MNSISLKFVFLLLFSLPFATFSFAEKVGATTNVEGKEKKKKVLFIGIDGLVWKTLTKENAPTLASLMKKSWVSTNSIAETPTWSANGWSALFTGVSVKKHKAQNNSFSGSDFVNYPTFFRDIKKQRPDARTVSIASWEPIHDIIIEDADITKKITESGDTYEQSDAKNEAAAIEELKDENPDVLFCYFAQTDEAGHNSNYLLGTDMYMQAVKQVDQRIHNVLLALNARPNYKKEDWLIVVSTDHGGSSSHGGASYDEQNVFIILNNKAIKPKVVAGDSLIGAPYLYDVPATVLSFIGLPIPEYYDGKALVKF